MQTENAYTRDTEEFTKVDIQQREVNILKKGSTLVEYLIFMVLTLWNDPYCTMGMTKIPINTPAGLKK